jgi:LDH2 family malate/lactate/ureidoglycolate dehydrogenase
VTAIPAAELEALAVAALRASGLPAEAAADVARARRELAAYRAGLRDGLDLPDADVAALRELQ